MWKKLTFLASVGLLLATTGNAAPIVITTADGRGADTYLANDGQGGNYGPTTTHGADTSLRSFRQYANTRSKAAFIRFDLGDAAGDMSGAILTFDLTYQKGGGGAVNVYGLIDGDGDFWDEETTSYNTAPGVIPNPPTALGNCVLDTTKWTLLGTITSPATPSTYPLQFSSTPASLPLADFLEADTNKLVTFIFLGGASDEGEVASKEHATYNPPTLTLPNAGKGARTSAIYRSPANEANDVSRDAVLSWTPGALAATHDVYLGTDSGAVTSGDASVLVGPGQDANTYDPPGHLEFGRTYYWRVDEVNGAPDFTVHPGKVWSFTVEPMVREVEDIVATASSSEATAGPENTVNGSGLDSNGLHSTLDKAMWLSARGGPEPVWIQCQFDRVYKLQEMWVWNYNMSVESILGLGFKEVTVEYSVNGEDDDWKILTEAVFLQGTSADGYAHNTTVDFQGVGAKYVRLTAKSNYGAPTKQCGLSEVKFFYIPAHATMPSPASGQTGVSPNVVLSWRGGREADSHEVYFSADQQAVVGGTVLAGAVDQCSFDTASLKLEVGKTYYWKVVEVNQTATPDSWESDLWSFSTQEFIPIDDFESYSNESPDRVFQAWIDGWGFSGDAFFPTGNPGNGTGSMVGYDPEAGSIMELAVIHGGEQSMPVEYNNVNQPYYSEIERTWETSQNWTLNGADTLQVWFRGNPVRFVQTAPNSFTMGAGGADIFGTSDQFTFTYKSLNGDGSIIAKVESIGDTDPWAKAGVMIRESLSADSRFAGVYATPGNGVRFQARSMTALDATSDTSVATTEQIALRAPVWVKVERIGTTFNGYYSTDGVKWTAMSWNPQTIGMGGQVYVGLAVTSHNANAATTGVFANVATTGGASGSWQFAEIGIDHQLNDRDNLYMMLKDSAGHSATVANADADAVLRDTWQAWNIPLADFRNAGVNPAAVKTMSIGVGNPDKPAASGSGRIYIDDIGYGRSASAGSQ
ncbi:MAG: discoidin domain-containing protein [Sedimentisphaerales bacterium]|nr:discoidin domain-containing protein [Sedimentisphaerales bacterium]